MVKLTSVPGSSLIEALVALVIMSVILSTTMMCFQNIWAASATNEEILLDRDAQFMANTSELEGSESLIIINQPYNENENLKQRTIIGLGNNGDSIIRIKQLLPNESN